MWTVHIQPIAHGYIPVEVQMNREKRATAYADCSIFYYQRGDIRRAARYWNRIYKLPLSPAALFRVMQKFTDEQVYTITDRNREQYYRAVGIL